MYGKYLKKEVKWKENCIIIIIFAVKCVKSENKFVTLRQLIEIRGNAELKIEQKLLQLNKMVKEEMNAGWE